jgi:hypothetical protein
VGRTATLAAGLVASAALVAALLAAVASSAVCEKRQKGCQRSGPEQGE